MLIQDIQNWLWIIIPHGEKREKIEDTKWVNRRTTQQNGQKKKYKRANNVLQNITHKTKDLPLVFTFSIDEKYAL